MKHIVFATLLVYLLLTGTSPVMVAQDSAAVVLGYDTEVTGMIDDNSSRNVWPLEVTALDRISIRVERTSGNLLPELILRDPNGDEMAQSFGPDNTGAAAVIENVRLERAGEHQILVQRKGFEDGLTSGEYSLEVTLLASGAESEANSTVINPIEYNSFVEGRITPAHWLHRYSLTAPAADYLQLTGRRNAGTLMPEVEILDSDGNSLRTGYTENSGDFATLSYELPEAGDYTVVITRSRRYDGISFGTYRLTLDLLGAGEGSPVLDAVAGSVEYGAALVSELGDGQWYQDWLLTVDAGDVITIVQQRPLDAAADAGNLRPEVALLDSTGQELRRGYLEDNGAEAVINHYELDAPGEYTVRASRERGQTGTTGGSYVLTVTLEGAGAGSPALAEMLGTLELNAPVEGEISNGRWRNAWQIDATADQEFDIRVERSGGTLIPLIVIEDSAGQQIRTIYPEASQDIAEVRGYRFPAAASYRVVVLRDGEARGYTTGTYQLSLAQPAEE